MKLIKGNDKGFFALCNDAARHIADCVSKNSKWHIRWGPETLYYDKAVGPNVWEYYFKQLHPYEPPSEIVNECIDLNKYVDNSFRKTMFDVYSKYIILNEITKSRIEPHFDYFNKHNILGVHIRRTDKLIPNHCGTLPSGMPVDLGVYLQEIDAIIDRYDKIYLACDCSEACDLLHKRYGKNIIFNRDATRGSGWMNVHNNFRHISGYNKGFDVLSDVIFLSKCKHLIRASSNVSITALYLNLNLTYINLNEKYLGDNESDYI